MIAAVIQADLRRGRRSRNFATLTAAIRRTAEHHPVPDLIAVPDCCAATLTVTPPNLLTPAMCQAFTETLAWQARDWGVWLAAGHARAVDGRIVAGATLFDPDGDAYLRYPPPPGQTAAPGGGPEHQWAIRHTPLGVVALCSVDAALDAPTVPAFGDPSPDVVIVPCGVNEAPHDMQRLAELARGAQCYVCFVNCRAHAEAQVDAAPMPSAIVDRQGNVMAQTSPQSDGPAVAELDITVSAFLPGKMEDAQDRE